MTNGYTKWQFIKICLLGLLVSGCASTPNAPSSKFAGEELNDKALDVLFATEFPVESKTDATARATQALKKGELNKALFFYVRALQFEPEDVELLAQIGEIHTRRNDLMMAKRAFMMARHYDPNHAQSLEALGLIYMSEGKDDQAISEFNSAVANNGQLWRAHNALGVYADKAGDFAAAQRHYDAALAIRPDAAQVLNNRGYSKFLAGDADGAAVDFYEAANHRGFSQAWANLGMIYAKQGRYDEAIDTYKQIMSEAHAYNNAGNAAIENGDFAAAKAYLLEAIRLSPTYFPTAEKNLLSLKNRN